MIRVQILVSVRIIPDQDQISSNDAVAMMEMPHDQAQTVTSDNGSLSDYNKELIICVVVGFMIGMICIGICISMCCVMKGNESI